MVFKFAISGDVGKESFDGSIFVSGTEYGLDCNVSDDGKTLVCVGGDGINKLAGKTVYGSVNGFPFTAQLPGTVGCTWHKVLWQDNYGEGIFYLGYVGAEGYGDVLSSWENDEYWSVVHTTCETSVPAWLWNDTEYDDTFGWWYVDLK